jgi:nucleoside-diphosphate-sugar epimerase
MVPAVSRVLVTGAGGFVGSHLAEDQLRRGLRVRALDLHLQALSGITDGRFERIEGDVTNATVLAQALAGVDVVYHLASKHLEVGIPDAEYRRVNVEGTGRLLELAAEAGVRRFVYCSTTGLMGHIANPPADEEAPARPDIIYEQTKWEAEQLVRDFARRATLETVIVRPAWVYGPRCPRTEKLFRAAEKGRFLLVGDGSCLRHPIYVGDMSLGFHLAGTVPGIAGRTYIIGGDHAVPVRELVDCIARTVGKPMRFVMLPRGVAALLFRAVEGACLAVGKKPPFSSRSLKFFTQQTAYDISRARRDLGFAPAQSLEEGLRQTWAAIQGGRSVQAHGRSGVPGADDARRTATEQRLPS